MMNAKKRYKEVFSQIHSTKNFDWENMYMNKPSKTISKRILCVAAATVLLGAFCLTAYATDFFGLRDLLLPQQHEIKLPADTDSPNGQEQQVESVDVILLVGYSDTPEAKAAAEWQAFLAGYDDGGALEQIGNSPTGFEEMYGLYLVYTQEMADKLDEITAKYRLNLHSSVLIVSKDELLGQAGGDFCGENSFGVAYLYEDGTFGFDGAIELEDYGLLDYQFLRAVRGSFTDTLLNIGDANDYTEWRYTTRSGVPVTLALAGYKALVIVDLPDSFVTINVLAGTETPESDIFSNGSLTAETLERFADSFDFSVLTPVLPFDAEAMRTAQQQKEAQEDSSQFWTITGLEMWQAQEFYCELIRNIENGDRQAVAEKILYPATVTVREGTGLAEITVRNAEEFLTYYDDIFTESLWWDSIMANQYTKERADLFAHDGMVGAAGGAIWFALAEGGIRVFTVQNSDGYSVRCGA